MARRTTFGGYKPPKLAVPKPLRPMRVAVARLKNPFEAAANQQKALEALAGNFCLSFTYEGLPRVVEVHTVGITTANRPAMSVYQVDGQSESGSLPDWRLFCFDECFNVAVTNLPAHPPRPKYEKGAKQFRRIIAEF